MKRTISLCLALAMLLCGCSSGQTEPTATTQATEETTPPTTLQTDDQPRLVIPTQGVSIVLDDAQITVDGAPVSQDATAAVHTASSIVYYEEGQDITYGAGSQADAHSAAEAEGHTVVTITQPGTYLLSGKLSAGQVAIDLGEDAKSDPQAVVNLVLCGVDITCTVAPAVIFYRVYECGDPELSTAEVDTSAAGANVYLADGSENNINGSYVAKIYKPETVTLSADGIEVESAKKLHKYDGAFYSKMSMNIIGNDGILNIQAENEGLDSELHLTILGGQINIVAGNDGINTNEDGVSVTTVNGGTLTITVDGATGEGDGIDSNGYLVINGGTVTVAACSFSADSGLDSDLGIYLNGGTVIATGNMLDKIEDGALTYVVLTFAQTQAAGGTYSLKNEAGETVLTCTPVNDFSVLVLASEALEAGMYTFWQDDILFTAVAGQSGGMPGGMGLPPLNEEWIADSEKLQPPDAEIPEKPAEPQPAGNPPAQSDGDAPQMPEGERPEGELPEGTPPELPEGEMPNGERPEGESPNFSGAPYSGASAQASETLSITEGGNYFSQVTPK